VNSFVAPAYKAYYDAHVPNQYPYNPAQAKALLAAAGWKPGSGGILTRAGAPFSLSILFPSTDSLLKETALIVQQNLADVGIKVNLVGEDPTTLFADLTKGHFDLQLSLDGPLYYPDLSRFYECNQIPPVGYNFGHFCDAALDKVFEGEKYAVGLATQQRLFNQMQANLNQNLPGLWLNSPRFTWFMDKQIQGYAPGIFLYPSSAYKWYY
jgi:ABC-type transport system substrate-binding protein